MRAYVKNNKYNEWWNKYLESQRKTLIILECPHCEKETGLSHPYEPVDPGTKILLECEECKKPFYATINIKTETFSLSNW